MNQRMRRAVVLANGEVTDPILMRMRLAAILPAMVIAADAGARHAAPLGLALDALVGDFDSLAPEVRATLQSDGVAVAPAPAHKDETDLELALLLAAGEGAQRIVVVGGVGGRLDMTIANVHGLAHPALQGTHVELWAGKQTAWLIRPPGSALPGPPGDTISLLPIGGPAEGITTTGLEYPLNDETLPVGPARGVSNVIAAEPASLGLAAGMLLAVHTPGRA